MITEVKMPKIGYTVEEGVIEKWHKKVGDRVETGELLLEVSSDKANLEVEAPAGGFLKSILAKEGDTIPVLQVIGYIEMPD